MVPSIFTAAFPDTTFPCFATCSFFYVFLKFGVSHAFVLSSLLFLYKNFSLGKISFISLIPKYQPYLNNSQIHLSFWHPMNNKNQTSFSGYPCYFYLWCNRPMETKHMQTELARYTDISHHLINLFLLCIF